MPVNRKNTGFIIGVSVLGALFLFWLSRLILLAGGRSAAYPQYSSLNNGSNGLQAYYEALARLNYRTHRNYLPLHYLTGEPVTLLYSGLGSAWFCRLPGAQLDEFEKLAESGVRLIVALDPKQVSMGAAPERKTDGERKNRRWGIEFSVSEEKSDTNWRYTWHLHSWNRQQWTGSGDFEGSPLFLERRFGAGSITLMADADLLTNSQLLKQPDAGTLAAVAGTRANIVFEESHLGVANTGSVAGLIWAHHLQWFLFGAGVLGVLYIWRSSVSFIPAASIPRETIVAGQDAYQALTSLLKESVPPAQLPQVLRNEWNSSWHISRRAGSQPIPENEAAAKDANDVLALRRRWQALSRGNEPEKPI
jgi:hypothetical protein